MRTTFHLPRAVEVELQRIGEGIRIARLRRGMSQEELARRMGVSFHTVRHIEQGRPGTAFGHYPHAMWILGIADTVSSVADPALDKEGLLLEAKDRRRKGGYKTASISNDF